MRTATAAVGTGVVVHGDPEPVEAQGCTEGSAGGPGRDKIDAIRHPQERDRNMEKRMGEVEIGGQIAERFLNDSRGRGRIAFPTLEKLCKRVVN